MPAAGPHAPSFYFLWQDLCFAPCSVHSPVGPPESNAALGVVHGQALLASWSLGGLPVLSSFSLAGVGSVPQVHIQGPEEDGVRVVCKASGWFPKPHVWWKALSGEKFLTFSETHAQDSEGLFSVEATVVVRDSSSGNVTCLLLNPILSQEKAMAIIIPGQCCFPLPVGP